MSQARRDDDAVLHRLADAIEKSNEGTAELVKSTDHLASEEYVHNLHDEQIKQQRRYLWGTVGVVIFAALFAFTNTFLLINLNNVIDANVESRNILLNQLQQESKEQERAREQRYEEVDQQITRMLELLEKIEDRVAPPPPSS